MEMESNANGHGSFLDFSKHNSLEEVEVDPVYKLFLEHLRIDGRSYILEMEDGDNGLPVFLKYENEDALSDSLQLDAHKNSVYNRFVEKKIFKPKRQRISKKSKPQSWKIVNLSGFHENQTKKLLATESYDEVKSTRNLPHLQFDGSDGISVPLKGQIDSSLADDSYQEFLSCLKVQNGLLVMEYNSVTVIYEGSGTITTNDNSGTDGLNRQLVLYESTLYESTLSPDVVIYEADENSMLPFDSCILSSFDLKLMAVLNKPYDQNEYEALWVQANYRKPVLRHKDLRGQCKSFSTRQMGLSYLDHFPDLATKLEHSDPQQSLVLLRGFFFWLKNLCLEGAYQPWIAAGPEMLHDVDDPDMAPPLEEEQQVEIEALLSPLVL